MDKAKKWAVFVGVVLLLLVVNHSQAAEFLTPTTPNGSLNITEPRRNLYAAGGSVTVNSNMAGDLFVAGGNLNVNGAVEQDLFAAGGSVNLAGQVGGDLRTAGGNITISGDIGGDLLAAGGNLQITNQSSVSGDLVVSGGSVNLEAPVNGNVTIASGDAVINSTINGRVFVRSGRLTFGPQSVVTNQIVYFGQNAAEVQQGARVSSIEFHQTTTGARNAGRTMASVLLDTLALFAATWVVARIWRRPVETVSDLSLSDPWPSLGIGLVALLLFPIVAIVLFITVVGYYLGLLTLAAYFLMLLLTGILTAIYVGLLLFRWFRRGRDSRVTWAKILLGAFVVRLLLLIPVVGWILVLIISLISLGSLVRTAFRRRAVPSPAAPDEAAQAR